MKSILFWPLAVLSLLFFSGCDDDVCDEYPGYCYDVAIKVVDQNDMNLVDGIRTRDDGIAVSTAEYKLNVSGSYINESKAVLSLGRGADGEGAWLEWWGMTLTADVDPKVTFSLQSCYIFNNDAYYDIVTNWERSAPGEARCVKATFQGRECDVRYNPERDDYEITIRIERD